MRSKYQGRGVGKRTGKSKQATPKASPAKPSSTNLPQPSPSTPAPTLDPTSDPTSPIYFWRPQEAATGYLSQWYELPFRGRATDKDKDNDDGKIYLTAEHYMMHHKALLFGDAEVAAAILETPSPRDVKALGRAVRGFEQSVWERERARIVVEANWCKFSLPVVSPSVLDVISEGDEGNGTAGARKEGKEFSNVGEKGKEEEEEKEKQSGKFNDGPNPGHGLRTWKLGNADDALEMRAASFRAVLLATGDRELVEASPRDRIWGVGFGAKNAAANRRRWGLNLLGTCLMQVREQFRNEDEAARRVSEDGAGSGS